MASRYMCLTSDKNKIKNKKKRCLTYGLLPATFKGQLLFKDENVSSLKMPLMLKEKWPNDSNRPTSSPSSLLPHLLLSLHLHLHALVLFISAPSPRREVQTIDEDGLPRSAELTANDARARLLRSTVAQ